MRSARTGAPPPNGGAVVQLALDAPVLCLPSLLEQSLLACRLCCAVAQAPATGACEAARTPGAAGSLKPGRVWDSAPVTMMGVLVTMSFPRQLPPTLTMVGSSQMFISVAHVIWLFTVAPVSCTHRRRHHSSAHAQT